MINKFIKISFVIILVFTIYFSNVVYAQDEYDDISAQINALSIKLKQEMSYSTITDCEEKLSPLFDLKTVEFLGFLKRHYENKRFNSSLNHAAVIKFSEYKTFIESQIYDLATIYTSEDGAFGSEEYKSYVACSAFAQAYIDIAKQQLIDHARQTSYQKKSTILVEKYQSINSQLRELLMDSARMYANFETLKNKLPGFLSSCVIK